MPFYLQMYIYIYIYIYVCMYVYIFNWDSLNARLNNHYKALSYKKKKHKKTKAYREYV